jgi:hypothetical protein
MHTITREELRALHPMPAGPTLAELEAIDLLMTCAESDTGQSRRCRAFLLAWWNAESFGGFDLTNVWGLDDELANACAVVFGLVTRWHYWPTNLPSDLAKRFRVLATRTWNERNPDAE